MDFGSEICENSFLSGKSLWFDFEHCEKCFDVFKAVLKILRKAVFQVKIA